MGLASYRLTREEYERREQQRQKEEFARTVNALSPNSNNAQPPMIIRQDEIDETRRQMERDLGTNEPAR